MITLRKRIAQAAAVAACLTVMAAPLAADPGPKPDFSIQTHEEYSPLFGDTMGTWKMTGVVHDSGTVSGFQGFPASYLSLEGEHGTLGVVVYIDPETYEESCEVTYGTGSYQYWVGATGTYDVAFGRYQPLRTVRRKMKGYLPGP